MAWLESILGSEGNTGLQLVLLTLGLMLVLILIFWIFRKIVGTPASRAARNRVPRLSVSDAAVVDDKRRLVLVRRDDVEHLVMIGGPTDVVVESNVIRTQPAAVPSTNTAPAATPVQPPAPAPVEEKQVAEEPKEVETGSKLAAVTGAAVATASAATASVAASADDVAEETKSSGMSVFDSLREKVSSTSTEEPAVAVKDEVESAAEVNETASAEPEATIEDSITAELDDALSGLGVDVEDNSLTLDTPDSGGDIAVSEDDDMQKLLDELAMEVKEPAQ